jgi:uncharacterized protein (TIGR02246 family)
LQAGDAGVREARVAIEAANAKFSEAFARGDAQALAAMYTSDAIVLPPESEMIRGNKAIGGFWKATKENGVQAATLTTLEVSRSGDIAYEVGSRSDHSPSAKGADHVDSQVCGDLEAAGRWHLEAAPRHLEQPSGDEVTSWRRGRTSAKCKSA